LFFIYLFLLRNVFFDSIFYTIFNTHESLYTDPAGNPEELVGILIIDKLLTNVALHLSVVIPEPTINDVVQFAVLFIPPDIPE
jgi:hypothetical protein